MFHSLQATLKRRFSHGVQFQAAYTWSKAMTSVQGTGQTAVFVGGSGNSNDPANRFQRWSPAGFDRTHRMVIVLLVLLNARQNLRQYKYARLLEGLMAPGAP
jgi:hypothetical protein